MAAQGHKSQFVKHLRSKGLPFTPQRARVLDAVVEARGHFAAEDLYMRLGLGPGRVSRATVYRTLDLLVECGVVQKVRLDEEHFRFELARIGKHHDHLVCERCGQVIEFFSGKIEGLQQEICKGVRFSPAGHTLVIYGLCERCSGACEDTAQDKS